MWYEMSSLVILCFFQERIPLIKISQAKCARYYPSKSEKISTYGIFSVTLLSKETAAYEIKTRKLILEKSGAPPRMLLHVQYSAWPDFGLPTAGTQGFRECIHLVCDEGGVFFVIDAAY